MLNSYFSCYLQVLFVEVFCEEKHEKCAGVIDFIKTSLVYLDIIL